MNSLHLSGEAQADLEDIRAYLSEELENPAAALAVLRKITTSIRTLRNYALIGAPLSSITDVESDYRFLITGNYLTFYHVNGKDVYVDRILYGRRDYLRVLFGESPDESHRF